ncbi:MAG: hypothetical protein QNK31_02455, partial [Porticoccus sp.]|nr:hypothetical protein [Porticoccus sp.]
STLEMVTIYFDFVTQFSFEIGGGGMQTTVCVTLCCRLSPDFSTTTLSGICIPKMVLTRDADEKKKTIIFRQV